MLSNMARNEENPSSLTHFSADSVNQYVPENTLMIHHTADELPSVKKDLFFGHGQL